MKRLVAILAVLLIFPTISNAMPVVLDHVPSYSWYHGCSPTAGAMIMGYWDLHGYDNLFDASGWDEVRQTENVKDQISSPEHNAKYDPRPDIDDDLMPQTWTSVADFMHTSAGNLWMGWTWNSNIDDGLREYPAYRGYSFEAEYFAARWLHLTDEIDAGRPLLANIQSHSMIGIGYDDRGEDGLWFAAYNTWHESEKIDWFSYDRLVSMIFVRPQDAPIDGLPISYNAFSVVPNSSSNTNSDASNPVPEPVTLFLLSIGLIGLAGTRRNIK